MRKNTTVDVIEEFAKKRERAKALQEARILEIHAAIPDTVDIDSKTELKSLEILSAVMSGEDADEVIEKVRKETALLRKKRDELLVKNGYEADYTDIRFECPECGDTGFKGMDMCSCLKKALANAMLEDSGLSNLVKTQSFESFSLDFYEGKARVFAEKNFNVLKDFAENFENYKGKNFILMGDTGLGKTHLSTSVAKVVIDKGFKVAYDSASDIMADFEAEHFKDTVSAEELRKRYMETDLLIIDDLGCEMITQFTVTCVYNLINSRLSEGLSTIINTNLSQNELREKYADRITSRIFGEYRPLLFLGRDIRQQKLK